MAPYPEIVFDSVAVETMIPQMTQATILTGNEGEWLSFHGIPVRIVASEETTSSRFMASVGLSLPEGETPPHAHTFEEGFYLLEGEMTFRAGDQRVTLRKGDFIQIHGNQPHQPINESGEPTRLLTIGAPSGFDQFQREVGQTMAGPNDEIPPVPADIQSTMEDSAAEHGIRFGVGDDEFSGEPEITIRRAGEGEMIAVVGDVYRFLATGEDTDGSYAIWHATIYPGGGPPPHVHRNEEEFFFVLKGELTVFDDGEKTVAGPDSAINLPRNGRHWFRNETEDPVEALILVAPAGLEKMFRRTGQPWSTDRGAAPHPNEEEIKTLQQVAPEFGIELG